MPVAVPVLATGGERGSDVAARFRSLEAKLSAVRPTQGTELVHRAFEFASERHSGCYRKSGDPYISHPLEVAHILADMRLDQTAVSAGLLHDVLEDTPVTLAELRREFGEGIALCVDGVTKIGRLRYQSSEDRQAETFRKMLLAMVQDIRVILIKLADRTHNMRTLGSLDTERQRRISLETREIYAPVALRLGMGKVRSELEDLAFLYLEPSAYRAITAQIESRREASEDFLAELQRTLLEKLERADIPASVHGRIKRPYSIYQKLRRQNVTFDMVYDLLALRVITDTKTHCYASMGVIHGQWQPVPGRIKDFVAMPRPNMYQSLHTSVVTREGQRFEVQIRTEEMHEMAEEGICAHWKYKEGKRGRDAGERQMAWLRRLVEWQRDMQDPSDFLSTLKIDLYPEEVYVFTPKGKVITLPRDATPVDFAYAIHTEVGHACVGAKVDGQIASLRRPLANGEIVEVITKSGSHPTQDWLSFAKTSRARNKIKQWINAERRRQAIEIGRRLLEREARQLKLPFRRVSGARMNKVCRDYGCSTLDDLHARLGYGRMSVRPVLRKMFADQQEPAPPRHAKAKGTSPEVARGSRSSGETALEVDGIDGVLVYRGRCCNPIPGDSIVGYVTRGRGVGVHSTRCANVQRLMYDSERRIDVRWARKSGAVYPAHLTAYVDDRKGILKDVTSAVANAGLNITRIKSRELTPGETAAIAFVVEVADRPELERVAAALAATPSVRSVERSNRF